MAHFPKALPFIDSAMAQGRAISRIQPLRPQAQLIHLPPAGLLKAIVARMWHQQRPVQETHQLKAVSWCSECMPLARVTVTPILTPMFTLRSCVAGVSRSATVVIGWLMRTHSISYDVAFKSVLLCT